MHEIEIKYLPHQKQKIFHENKTKFRLICTGIGFGKSAAGVNELLKVALHCKPGCLIAMIGPTLPMLKNTTLREFFKFCPHELIKNHNKSERIITIVNDVDIIYLSGDNDADIERLRGMNLGAFYGDEIVLQPESLHNILTGRLRDPRGPMKGWYTTTPKGFNWMYRLFVEKKKQDGTALDKPDDYEIFLGYTRDNPYTPDEYKDSLEALYTGTFAKQELLGEFVGFEGLVYPDFSQEKHVIDTKKYMLKDIFPKRLVAGIDWGYTNPMVFHLWAIDGDDRMYLLHEFHERKIQIEQLIDEIKNVAERYLKLLGSHGITKIDTIYADPSEPQFIDKIRSEGFNIVAADNAIVPGIQAVTQKLQDPGDGKPMLMIDKSCLEVINEFNVYRYPEIRDGRPTQENPLKVFDHAMDAIKYVIMGCGGSQMGVPKAIFGKIRKVQTKIGEKEKTPGEKMKERLIAGKFKIKYVDPNSDPEIRAKYIIKLDQAIQELKKGIFVCREKGRVYKPVECYNCKKDPCCQKKDIERFCIRKGVDRQDVYNRYVLLEKIEREKEKILERTKKVGPKDGNG